MAKKKIDTTIWKIVPLTYTEGIPPIYVRGKESAEYVNNMFLNSGRDTLMHTEGYYPEFDEAGTLK